jgi:hypothetical protein
MIPGQRWEKIDQTLNHVATLQRSHDEQIGKLVEQGDRNERLIGTLTEGMDVLTERTIQAMDASNRLANIAASHEERTDKLEDGSR